MNPLSKEHFIAMWNVLLDNFRQSRNDFTVAFIYQTLMDRDPGLTTDQFTYAVQQCLVNCKFMPNVNELLRQLYEPDLTGIPAMPDIDPRYADEYQLNHYHKALNTVNQWVAQNDHRPDVGRFRQDRLKEIPGIPQHVLEGCDDKWSIHSSGGYLREGSQPDFLGFGSSDRSKPSQHEEEMNLEREKRKQIQRLRSAE